jgi:hypothetical protein
MANELSPMSILYAKRATAKLFSGRKGHGGGPCMRRVLGPGELETIIACAFEMGRAYDERKL